MRTVASTCCLLLLMPVVTGCGKNAQEKETIYDIKGKVVGLDLTKKQITLDHEDIPGRMRAMKMSFEVADAKVLEGLNVGDQVVGKLTKQNVILELRKQ